MLLCSQFPSYFMLWRSASRVVLPWHWHCRATVLAQPEYWQPDSKVDFVSTWQLNQKCLDKRGSPAHSPSSSTWQKWIVDIFEDLESIIVSSGIMINQHSDDQPSDFCWSQFRLTQLSQFRLTQLSDHSKAGKVDQPLSFLLFKMLHMTRDMSIV